MSTNSLTEAKFKTQLPLQSKFKLSVTFAICILKPETF